MLNCSNSFLRYQPGELGQRTELVEALVKPSRQFTCGSFFLTECVLLTFYADKFRRVRVTLYARENVNASKHYSVGRGRPSHIAPISPEAVISHIECQTVVHENIPASIRPSSPDSPVGGKKQQQKKPAHLGVSQFLGALPSEKCRAQLVRPSSAVHGIEKPMPANREDHFLGVGWGWWGWGGGDVHDRRSRKHFLYA